MAVTVRSGTLIAASALVLCACSGHHSPEAPRAGSPGAMAGRESKAGEGSLEAGRETGPAITPPGARAFAHLVAIDPGKRDVVDRFEVDATFSAQVDSIDVSVKVRGCTGEKPFPLVIKEGNDCGDETLSGPNWDAPRGEGIAGFNCIGPGAAGMRSNDADKPWTIGGPSESDVIGHAMVVLDPLTSEPVLCGVIERADDAVFVPTPPATGTKLQLQAQVAGICLSSTFAGDDNTRPCPDPAELVKCSSEHCNLGACLEACKDFTACLETKDEPCKDRFECTMSDACTDCQQQVGYCAFSFCLAEVSCAPPPTPDGPCAQLTACCQMQGDEAERCLGLVRVIERISGDVSCAGVMVDWDTTHHLPVPCKYEDR